MSDIKLRPVAAFHCGCGKAVFKLPAKKAKKIDSDNECDFYESEVIAECDQCGTVHEFSFTILHQMQEKDKAADS